MKFIHYLNAVAWFVNGVLWGVNALSEFAPRASWMMVGISAVCAFFVGRNTDDWRYK